MGDLVAASGGSAGWLLKILYVGFFAGPISAGPAGPNLIVLYSIVPWVGVMAVGYAFGAVMTQAPATRRRACLIAGVAATLLFVALRASGVYGDPNPWVAAPQGNGPAMPSWLSFLNTTKYPASLSFLLMTLGPTLVAMAIFDALRGPVSRALAMFGRVPFFFYALHIPLIHALALVVSVARLGAISPWLFANHPMGNPPPPPGYAWSLPLLYAVWAAAIGMLFVACRWFAALKARRTDWWLAYF